jgi:cell division control protein 6
MPGTGKTALLRSILAQLREDQLALPAPRIAFVNCMTIEHPRAIFAKVLQALGERDDVPASAGTDAVADALAERDLGALVKDPKRRTLIVLDEIDHLLRNRAQQNVLYRLFSWAATAAPSKNGRGTCALIGIANSLDLTERFVPLLASKGAPPALLHFRPFGAAEIVSVVRARLCGLRERYDGGIVAEETMDVDPTPALFTPAALELAAKKIAQATGDLRKALDAARLAVDAVETEQRKKLLAVPGAEDSATLLAHFTPIDAPKVTPAHILRVLSAVLGSPQLAKVRSLGLQPKLVLLAILVAQRRAQEGLAVLGSGSSGSQDGSSSKTRALRLVDVEATYAAAIKNDGCAFSTLEASEFLDVVELLGVHGLVSTSDGESNAAAASSAGARRASKKQLQAANRSVALAIGADEVLKGITTPPPASSGIAPQTSTLEAVRRMWNAEEERIRRTRGWEARAREMQSVRDVELGGGRMAQGSF